LFHHKRPFIFLDMYMPRDYISSLNSQTAPKLNIFHRLPNHNPICPTLQNPSLLHNIPRTHIPPVKLKRDFHLLARLQELLLKPAQHALRPTGDVQVQLRHFGRGHGACVLDRDAHTRGCAPQCWVAAFGLHMRAVAVVRGALRAGGGVGCEAGGQRRVGEVGVCQAVAESVLGRDVAGDEVFIVDVDALCEIVLQEISAVGVWNRGVQKLAVVGGLFGDGVGQAAGGGLYAVENVDNCLAGFLAGEVGEDDGGDVGVVDEAVDDADAGVVDYDLGVVALACDVDD
jgi:hypothetical protein